MAIVAKLPIEVINAHGKCLTTFADGTWKTANQNSLSMILCILYIHVALHVELDNVYTMTTTKLSPWPGLYLTKCHPQASYTSRISCQEGPTRHAYAWQIRPFWQDTLDMCLVLVRYQKMTARNRERTVIHWMIKAAILQRFDDRSPCGNPFCNLLSRFLVDPRLLLCSILIELS